MPFVRDARGVAFLSFHFRHFQFHTLFGKLECEFGNGNEIEINVDFPNKYVVDGMMRLLAILTKKGWR